MDSGLGRKPEIDPRVKNFIDRFVEYESFHEPFRDRFLRYYQYYRCYIEKDYYFETLKLVPYAFTTIMSILPRLVVHKPKLQYVMNRIPNPILKDGDLAEKVDSIEDMTERDKVLAINRLRDKHSSIMNFISEYQWEQINGDTRLSESLLTSLIYGTFISHYYWDDDTKTPNFDTLLPFNFFPDPSCTHVRDLKRCFRRVYKNVEDVKGMIMDGIYTMPDGFDIDDLEGMTQQSKDRVDMNKRVGITTDISANDIEIVEYYDCDKIVTILNRSIIVREQNHDYGRPPFIVGYNYHTPGEFWGIGEVELIEQYIDDATDLRANRKENMVVSTNNQWVVDIEKKVYYEDLISAPNQIIRAEGGASTVTPLPKQPISRESYMEEDIYRRDMTEISGTAEYFRGTRPDGGVETATAINSLADTSNARWNLKLKNLNDYFLKPLGKVWIELNKKYLKPLQIRLDQKDKSGNYLILNIDKEVLKSIKTDYDIRVVPGNNRTTTKEQVNMLLQTLASSEMFAQAIKIPELLQKILEAFDIPVFDVVKTDEEIQEEIAAQQAAEQAAMQQQQVDPREQMRQQMLQAQPPQVGGAGGAGDSGIINRRLR